MSSAPSQIFVVELMGQMGQLTTVHLNKEEAIESLWQQRMQHVLEVGGTEDLLDDQLEYNVTYWNPEEPQIPVRWAQLQVTGFLEKVHSLSVGGHYYTEHPEEVPVLVEVMKALRNRTPFGLRERRWLWKQQTERCNDESMTRLVRFDAISGTSSYGPAVLVMADPDADDDVIHPNYNDEYDDETDTEEDDCPMN